MFKSIMRSHKMLWAFGTYCVDFVKKNWFQNVAAKIRKHFMEFHYHHNHQNRTFVHCDSVILSFVLISRSIVKALRQKNTIANFESIFKKLTAIMPCRSCKFWAELNRSLWQIYKHTKFWRIKWFSNHANRKINRMEFDFGVFGSLIGSLSLCLVRLPNLNGIA